MKKRWRYVHWFIILSFVFEAVYGFYMVFFVIGGGKWPLFTRAVETPVEVILKRRLYSIETWVSVVGLALYLALTEFLPQKLKLLRSEE